MSVRDYYSYSFTYNFTGDELIKLLSILFNNGENELTENLIKAYINSRLDLERGDNK